jgi:hypothetical protein
VLPEIRYASAIFVEVFDQQLPQFQPGSLVIGPFTVMLLILRWPCLPSLMQSFTLSIVFTFRRTWGFLRICFITLIAIRSNDVEAACGTSSYAQSKKMRERRSTLADATPLTAAGAELRFWALNW